MLFCLSLIPMGNAQDLKAGHIKKVKTEASGYFPSFGPGNNEIVLTGQQNQGLSLLDTRTGKIRLITDEPVITGRVSISGDKKIIFSVRGETKESTVLKAFNPENGAIETVQPALQPTQVVRGKGRKLEYTGAGNTTKELAPLGEVFYLWPSVSPDGSRILFTAATKGCYVCDLEGNIVAELGKLNAPTWINDEWVLGMRDVDDGHTIQSSDILAIHVATGKTVNITGKSAVIALYPKASQDGRAVVFQNPAGEIYTTRIRIKK